MKNKLAKNSLAVGVVTLIVTAGLSFSANGAATDRYVSHSEARFLAGTSGIAEVTDAISRAVEGQSADVSTAQAKAGDRNDVQQQDDVAIPLGGLASISLGAVDNYASASSDGTALASSGVVGDNGLINTDYDGPKGSVTINLEDGSLTGPVADALADVKATVGAVSAQAQADKGAVSRKYNIANASLDASLPALTTINTQLSDALGGYNLLSTLTGTNEITLSNLAPLFPTALAPITDLIGTVADNLVDVDVTIPSVNSITSSLADYSEDGVDIDVSEGTVHVDLVDLLNSLPTPLDINHLPKNTDLLQYVLPAIASGLDEIVDNAIDTVVDNIIDSASVKVTLLSGLVPAITLDGSALDPLLAPVRTGLDGLLDPIAANLSAGLATSLDDNALGQILQLKVNNYDPDLYGENLVTGDAPAAGEGPAASITALRVQLLGGELADLRLGNAVVVPDDNVVQADDTDAVAADDTDADTDTDTDTNAAADADSSDNDAAADTDADAVADADAQADADVTTTLPSTGAPNLLPFWALGLALLMFGGAVLVNEKRRLGKI
jgi:hypothetical protein